MSVIVTTTGSPLTVCGIRRRNRSSPRNTSWAILKSQVLAFLWMSFLPSGPRSLAASRNVSRESRSLRVSLALGRIFVIGVFMTGHSVTSPLIGIRNHSVPDSTAGHVGTLDFRENSCELQMPLTSSAGCFVSLRVPMAYSPRLQTILKSSREHALTNK